MYPPPHHQSNDIQKMIAVIEQFPLGMLVSAIGGIPFVTHIPIVYNKASGNLVAHIDKSNPQMTSLSNDAEVTAVFRGPDTYISPSIYTTSQLPTWNYIIVHITGTIQLINDPEAAKETMIAMTKFLEGIEQNYTLEKDDPKMKRMVNYIQAFDIKITNWEGKFKLSQDKNEQDFENAKAMLLKHQTLEIREFIDKIYE